MRRLIGTLVLLVAIAVPVLRGQDNIYYKDPNVKGDKEPEIIGVIEKEGPAGVWVKQGKETKLIRALDITRIDYKQTKLGALEFRRPAGKESLALLPQTSAAKRKMLLQEALAGYQENAPKFADVPNISRYLQFKIAAVKYHLAKDDPTQADPAIEALKTYAKDFPTGWEVVPALKMLAELEEKKGNTEGARQAYEDLANLPEVPADLKQTSEVLVAQLLMRGRKYPQAEAKLAALKARLGANDPQQLFVSVYLAQVQLAQHKTGDIEKQLKTVLGTTTDASLKADAYNTLGDYYREKNQSEDAFWNYLRVEVLYPQDRAEHAKALYWLWKLFDKTKNDPVRAEECYHRLADKLYEGTEHHALALSEKKPTP
jgi:hypothetical protein